MLESLSRCNGTMAVLYDLVCKLENIGLPLKAAKKVVLTSEVQPPSFLHTSNGGRYTNMINGGRIKEYAFGSPTSSSSWIESFFT